MGCSLKFRVNDRKSAADERRYDLRIQAKPGENLARIIGGEKRGDIDFFRLVGSSSVAIRRSGNKSGE